MTDHLFDEEFYEFIRSVGNRDVETQIKFWAAQVDPEEAEFNKWRDVVHDFPDSKLSSSDKTRIINRMKDYF